MSRIILNVLISNERKKNRYNNPHTWDGRENKDSPIKHLSLKLNRLNSNVLVYMHVFIFTFVYDSGIDLSKYRVVHWEDLTCLVD